MEKMDNEIKRGCGIDIDSITLWVTIFIITLRGTRTDTKEFSNTVSGIKELKKWLKRKRISHVAFESTGYFWQMLYSFLETDFTIVVANPRQIKQLKGKKTDRLDSKSLAILLRNGAIRPSFILPKEFREFRDLTRQYQNLVHDLVRVKNRIRQTLWHACIPLDKCMSDIFGKSGHAIIEALINGVPGKEAAQLAKGRLKGRIALIEEALRFPLSNHYREVLDRYWEQYLSLKEEISQLNREIDTKMSPYNAVIQRLCSIPGIGRKLAQSILSEIGIDMTRFPNAKHFASWTKLCPGNNSSAGKRKSGRNSRGNKYVRSYLVEAAWAAVSSRGSAFRSLYYRRAARLGRKKAIISIAHKLLRIIYKVLSDGSEYSAAYESELCQNMRISVARKRLREFDNEELVSELLSRGVKTVTWSWEEDEPVLTV